MGVLAAGLVTSFCKKERREKTMSQPALVRAQRRSVQLVQINLVVVRVMMPTVCCCERWMSLAGLWYDDKHQRRSSN